MMTGIDDRLPQQPISFFLRGPENGPRGGGDAYRPHVPALLRHHGVTVWVLVTVVEDEAGIIGVGAITVELRSVVVERSTVPDEHAPSRLAMAITEHVSSNRAGFEDLSDVERVMVSIL